MLHLVSLAVLALMFGSSTAATLGRSRRAVSPANLQLYATMGAYSTNFQAYPATVMTGWNNKTLNISTQLAEGGPFGWPDKAVAYCVDQCEKWSPCLSFDIDVVKEVCYLSSSRSQPTHSDGNAALFIRIQDFNTLKNTPSAVANYTMVAGQVQTGFNEKTVNVSSIFDKPAKTQATYCATKCNAWAECQSYELIWNKRLCYLSSKSTEPRHEDANAILFVKQCPAKCT